MYGQDNVDRNRSTIVRINANMFILGTPSKSCIIEREEERQKEARYAGVTQ